MTGTVRHLRRENRHTGHGKRLAYGPRGTGDGETGETGHTFIRFTFTGIRLHDFPNQTKLGSHPTGDVPQRASANREPARQTVWHAGLLDSRPVCQSSGGSERLNGEPPLRTRRSMPMQATSRLGKRSGNWAARFTTRPPVVGRVRAGVPRTESGTWPRSRVDGRFARPRRRGGAAVPAAKLT